MKRFLAAIFVTVMALISGLNCARSQSNDFWDQIAKLNWRTAGSNGDIGQRATIAVPQGYAFLGTPDTKRFLELQGNPGRDNVYVIAPTDLHWFGFFTFEELGYVKDDEKIDPDDLLETLRRSNKEGLEERKRANLPLIYLDGWFIAPHYDVQTKRLEWGTKLHDEQNDPLVNYTIKILGRRGVMNAILVSEPKNLDRDVRQFKAVLTSFAYKDGERYAEFRSGDKIAEYGLAALVVGGAAAAAAKSGALKGLGKFLFFGIAAACVACWAFVKRLFRRA